MQILWEIAGNGEGMFWYQMCSVCTGIGLIICRDEQKIWYRMLIYSVCAVNAFLWGSMFLFRLYFNRLSFLTGGILGSGMILLFLVMKKGSGKYFFVFWCLVKVLLVINHYLIEHDLEKQEEMIFGISICAASVLFVFILLAAVLYRLKKKELAGIKTIGRGVGVIYGSVLVTGCIYEFAHDVIRSNSKFLSVNTDYINFYKALFKVDWTGERTGMFFAVVCAAIMLSGIIYQGVFNARKGSSES